MNINTDIFKIQSNNVMPSRGKILISEPFLHDVTFGRSVVLLVDHTEEGSMGLIINKPLPLMLNDIIKEFKYIEDIPLHKGGPIGTDTLFYLHTLHEIPGTLPINNGLYLNGDFDAIKKYILQGCEQLIQEIKENTWIISKEENTYLMNEDIKGMWKEALGKLGSKYETWSRFPQVPSLN